MTELPFPRVTLPISDAHAIALVGCGVIGRLQLDAYRNAGWRVVVLCDAVLASAESARDEFFPDADATDDFEAVLRRGDVTIVDLAVHTDIRPDMVRRALLAGKNVMSQKPFVEDLEEGRELARLADERGLTLAVNQNGRWAPHFHALREIVDSGRLGRLNAADFAVYWPHDVHTEHHRLGQDPNLVLYDYAIHWFDLVACLFPDRTATSVYASTATRPGQLVPVPTLASVVIDFGDAQVTIVMRASSRHEDTGSFHVVGDAGAAVLHGGELGGARLDIVGEQSAHMLTVGSWFPDALIGSMGELMSAIEEGRAPFTRASSSLVGLALCFAAIESAATGAAVDPATVSRLYAPEADTP